MSVGKLSLIMIVTFSLGCSSDSIGPDDLKLSIGQVAGQYQSVVFSVGMIEVLSVGGSMDITLTTDRTCSGRLFIPDTLGLTEGGDFDADLNGTFTLSGSRIKFHQQSDTFVRDMSWFYKDGKLSANSNFTGMLITIELQR